ncbi:molybdenum cofactor biosynthesis protein [Photobacterium sp. SDRW27]|uniref:molybdenum cofactor biosynthesis protein n=1 Tax=Photobacterium obscurum TaxID=2829490 RepID=UPI002242D157|nr:molybdenum cofactor biosynthesis protein [Photobacterium obscurum]MCW8330252.1 molybdenum cofactor biosynthesis protein [Photobacterium obscurum]
MDVKKSWGYISILIGGLSLLWGAVSLSSMAAQEQVFSDMGRFMDAGGGDFFTSYNAEHAISEAKNKNVVILSTGLILSSLGSFLMRGLLDK